MGNVSAKKRQKKKCSNPQSQVCYTFVAPAEVHNRADDKRPGPHAAHCGLENNVKAVKG